MAKNQKPTPVQRDENREVSDPLENNSVNQDFPFEVSDEKTSNIPVQMNDPEGLPVTKEKKKRIIRNLISGAEFHDFEEDSAVVYGRFIGPVKREKDGPNVDKNPNEKAGTVMGYQVEEIINFDDDNERVSGYTIIGASEQINRGLERAKHGELYRFEFMGKTVNSKNQPVNRFRVDIIEEQD